MAAWQSRLIRVVTKAEAYMASSLRNMRSRQATSPARHCSVMFQAASIGITTRATSRSATARCRSSRRAWDPLAAGLVQPLHSTARLQVAEITHSSRVSPTRT